MPIKPYPYLISFLLLTQTSPVFAEEIIGHWKDKDGAIIHIDKCESHANKRCGRIVDFATKGNLEHADRKELKKLCNVQIIASLKPAQKGWRDGTIWDPETDALYSIHIEKKHHTISAHIFQNQEFWGETYVWTKVAPSSGDICHQQISTPKPTKK